MLNVDQKILKNMHASELKLKWDWKQSKLVPSGIRSVPNFGKKRDKMGCSMSQETLGFSPNETKASSNETITFTNGLRKRSRILTELKKLEDLQKETQKIFNKSLLLRTQSNLLYEKLEKYLEKSTGNWLCECLCFNGRRKMADELEEKFLYFCYKLEKQLRNAIKEIKGNRMMERFERRKKLRRKKYRNMMIGHVSPSNNGSNESSFNSNYNQFLISQIRREILFTNTKSSFACHTTNGDFEESFDVLENVDIEILVDDDRNYLDKGLNLPSFEVSFKFKSNSFECFSDLSVKDVDVNFLKLPECDKEFTFYSPQMDKTSHFRTRGSLTSSKVEEPNEDILRLLEPLNSDSFNSEVKEFSI